MGELLFVLFCGYGSTFTYVSGHNRAQEIQSRGGTSNMKLSVIVEILRHSPEWLDAVFSVWGLAAIRLRQQGSAIV